MAIWFPLPHYYMFSRSVKRSFRLPYAPGTDGILYNMSQIEVLFPQYYQLFLLIPVFNPTSFLRFAVVFNCPLHISFHHPHHSILIIGGGHFSWMFIPYFIYCCCCWFTPLFYWSLSCFLLVLFLNPFLIFSRSLILLSWLTGLVLRFYTVGSFSSFIFKNQVIAGFIITPGFVMS